MKFSEKIIKLRKENGLSQEEFGNKINVSRQAISKWESEQSQPEVEKVKEISKIFNVSIEYLLNDEMENDNTKKECKFNKKKFLKISLKVLLIIIAIYVLYSTYKFIILFKVYNSIQEISDNEICTGTMTSYYEDKIAKTILRNNLNFTNGEKMYIGTNYAEYATNNSQQNNLILQTIKYINKEKNIKFYLQYDWEKQKYVYSEKNTEEMLLDEEVYYSRKELYMQSWLDIFSEGSLDKILRTSLNPFVIVTNEYVKCFLVDGYAGIEFDDRGDVYEGISKSYCFTDDQETTLCLDISEIYDYNTSILNDAGEIIDYNYGDIETVEDLANFYGIEVIIEE